MWQILVLYELWVLFLFAILYYIIGMDTHFKLPSGTAATPVTAMYFGIVSHTTTGYGDIYPLTPLARVLVAVHLVGAWFPLLMMN